MLRLRSHERLGRRSTRSSGWRAAAGTLLALNELWGCGVDDVSLSALAGQVGSDVPAMLSDRPVKVRGRGEIVEPAAIPELHWVLLSLGFPTRSPDAYRWWDEDGS